MERRVKLYSIMLLYKLFLLSCSATLSYGGVEKDLAMAMEHHLHAQEAVMEIFEIDGHVIDCIDINEQPAFEHPLLANHTLQIKPTCYPENIEAHDHLVEASYPWNMSKSCPKGSIPIRRVQRENPYEGDLYMKLHHNSLRQGGVGDQKDDFSLHEHSTTRVMGGKHYGLRTSINVWNPKPETPSEFSLSQIWVASADGMVHLEAGWMVSPPTYDDEETRFFVFWTGDGYKTGCYNVRCPGFVQTNTRTILDSVLRPVSQYGGQQYAIDVEIFKDKTTGNWWLRLQDVEMGYWPKELVPSLEGGADVLTAGGEIYNSRSSGKHTSTPMGSGHFSSEGFKKSSFFRNVQVLDTSYSYRVPEKPTVTTESPYCYDIKVGEVKDGSWGYFFFYGGPGRSEKCT